MFSIPGVPNPTPSQIEEFLIAQIHQECANLIARQNQLGSRLGAPDNAAIVTLLTQAQTYFRTYDQLAVTLSTQGCTNLAKTLERVQSDLRSALAIQQETIGASQKSQADLAKWLSDQAAQIAKDNMKAAAENAAKEAAAIQSLIDPEG